MESIYIRNRTRYVQLFGSDRFNILYKKVSESKAIEKLIGATVTRGLPPTATDFLGSANTILYVMSKFSIATSIMAALIELKVWNENVNMHYQLMSENHLTTIAESISTNWL